MYVHFAGQIDKKTPKHNTPWCSVSLRGSTHRNLEVIEKKATYLIYQYFQSVQCCRWKGRPNIKLIDTCDSRLITSHQLLSIQSLNLQLITTFFIIKIWFLLVLVVMCSHSHQAWDEFCLQEINVQYLPSTTWVDIDLNWRHSPRACFLRYQSAYFPVLFRKSRRSCLSELLTAYNKQTKMNFQKLISKPFSTCLNLSNKLNLWKRCSWPLNMLFSQKMGHVKHVIYY